MSANRSIGSEHVALTLTKVHMSQLKPLSSSFAYNASFKSIFLRISTLALSLEKTQLRIH